MLADLQEFIYISSARTRDVVWRTYRERRMIKMEKESVMEIHAVSATRWNIQGETINCRPKENNTTVLF